MILRSDLIKVQVRFVVTGLSFLFPWNEVIRYRSDFLGFENFVPGIHHYFQPVIMDIGVKIP